MRYDTGILLGQGGMGEVYKAWDPTLERAVALKILHSYSADSARRLLREARAQASLDHPNICRVYEVGEDPDQLYIAMQYIEGETLDQVAPRMTLEEQVRVVAQVAEAIHAAHRTGLIHRDLKPANILVEETADAERWKPYVVDFGLVHQQDGTALTADGAVLGTPPYMAPEQAQGVVGAVDRRSDVYSLGATLYQLVTGEPVFSGSPMDLVLSTLHREPLHPRRLRPQLPADLATIILHCLEKEPRRRYPSARALAEDLRRFLDGEPILAHPPSWAYRTFKIVRKHRLLAAVVAVATLLVVSLAGVALHTRWQAARRAELAQRFTAEVKDVEWLMRAARMSPRHDIREQRREVARRMDVLEEQASDLGSAARAPASYAVGRGYLVLGDLDQAQDYLTAAWEAGYRAPEAAYALGLVYGRRYQQELTALRGIGDRTAREQARQRAQETLREPALQLLAASRGAASAVPQYLEGLIAFYEEDSEASLAAAAQALEAAPWLYEAEILRGDVFAHAANGYRDVGNRESAEQAYASAAEAYERATTIAASDVTAYLQHCSARVHRLEMELYGRGEALEERFHQGLATCRLGLEVDPEHPGILLEISTLWQARARTAATTGEETGPMWREALQAAHRVLEIEPENPTAWHSKAAILSERARMRAEQGEDPEDDFLQALEAARQGAARAPDPVQLLNELGIIQLRRAGYRLSQGIDPRQGLEDAVAAFHQAIELSPDYGYAFNNLGRAHATLARYQSTRGEDPRASLQRSADAYRRAVEINPENAVAWNNLGVTLIDRGEAALDRGDDPRPDLEQAEESLRRCQQINPEHGPSFNNLGLSAIYRARYLVQRGEDPSEALAAAVPALEETVRLYPTAFQPHVNLGRVEVERARYLELRGEDPEPVLLQARRHYLEALERNPRQTASLAELADVLLTLARHYREAGKVSSPLGSPEELLARAQRRAEAALEVSPKHVRGLTVRAGIALEQARWARESGAPDTQKLRTAKADLRRALAVRPVDADAAVRMARWGQLVAEPEALLQALEELRPAVEHNPRHPHLLVARDQLLQTLRSTGRAPPEWAAESHR